MPSEIIEDLSRKLEQVEDAGQGLWDNPELQARIEDFRNRAESLIREHPIASLAVALAVGYLLGRILSGDD